MGTRLLRTLAALLVAGGATMTLPVNALAADVGTCPMLPVDNIWNTRVDGLPAHPLSNAYVGSIGSTPGVHPDFGAGIWDGGPIGIPYAVVPGNQPKVPVTFRYDDQSDPVGTSPKLYPVPPAPPIEGGPNATGDRHVLLVDSDGCKLYELYDAHPNGDGSWRAGSGAIFDLRSNGLRPREWTSADAAGLPILPGLVRYEEVASGEIRHAIRVTAPHTQQAYVWPARHQASSLTDPTLPPMGLRLRLKAAYVISSSLPTEVQVILRALKAYGMILADNGSSWFISGVPDSRWVDDDLVTYLSRVKGSDFEAVDVSSLMVDPDSGQARSGAAPPSSTFTLTVTVSGTGTVTSSPPGIACTQGACGASFPSGTTVTLTPSGGTLGAWGGACTGAGACQVSMTQSRPVTATFAAPAPVKVTGLTANVSFPVTVGTAVTWAAAATGGTAPLQYRFWRFDLATNTWTMVRDYATGNTFAWAPPAAGQYQFGVWVRSAGSTAQSDAGLGTATFSITAAAAPAPVKVTGLTANVSFPVTVGTAVTWTAAATGGTGPLQYRFWRFDVATGAWTTVRDYAAGNTFVWTPTAAEAGQHQFAVWVRSAGSTAQSDAGLGTATFSITAAAAPAPVKVAGLTANVSFPVTVGTAVTWTAAATGGTGPLQYRFWRFDVATGAWTMVRDYAAGNTFAWTPTAAGEDQFGVWVRSAGSTAQFDARLGTATFTVKSR